MKRFFSWIGLSLLLVAALPLTTSAQFQGTVKMDMRTPDNVSMCGRDERAQETVCDFSAGTKQIGLVVDYQGLPADTIAVELRDDRGIIIFFKSDSVNGSGSKTYTVSGDYVYNEYVRLSVDNSNQIVGKLGQTTMSAYGKMQEASPLVAPTIAIIQQLERYGVTAAQGELTDGRAQLDIVFTKVKAVLETNLSAEAQTQAVTEALAAATQANTLLKAARPKLEGRTDLAFLTVDTAGGRKMTGKISRAGSQVDSLSWAVATTPIQRATAEPTRGPTNTPGPTATLGTQVVMTSTPVNTATPQPTATTAPVATAPAVVNPTATTAAALVAQPTATTAPPAAVTAAPPPAAATALRQPAVVPTTLPTSAATSVAQANSAAVQATPNAAAKAQSTAAPGGGQTDAAKTAAAKTEAQASPTPTTARVASKVDLGRLTPVAGDSRVAGQSSGGGLPWTTIGLIVVAVGLGGAALWMRRRV